MRLKGIPPLAGLSSVLACLAAAGLLAVWVWSRPLADAERSVRAGRLAEALERYAVGEARFDRVPLAKQILPSAYEASIANQLWLQYRLQRYDALLDKAAVAPASAPTHFWTGCALYEKARVEEDPDARLGWLGRAVDEFRQAVERAPENWDAKYNYELTRRLLAQIEKEPKTPPKELMQLIRPVPTENGSATRPIG